MMSLGRRQPPLAEFVPQPLRGRLAQRVLHDENEAGSPGVMMTPAAAPAARGLMRFMARPVVGGHDMGQLMQAGLFACADVEPVVCADLHPALTGKPAAS